jgi:hypothetical protein
MPKKEVAGERRDLICLEKDIVLDFPLTAYIAHLRINLGHKHAPEEGIKEL